MKKDFKEYIYDGLRKKYVILTPEEWVRQHMIHYLIGYGGYPSSLISVERVLDTAGRADILTYYPSGELHMIVECKMPQKTMSELDVAQLSRYNMRMGAPFVTITNGIEHFSFQASKEKRHYDLLKRIPAYNK